jgi:hypothetical protein
VAFKEYSMSVDLVLGVMQSVDQASITKATRKLTSLSQEPSPLFEKFAASLNLTEKIREKPQRLDLTGDILAGVMKQADPIRMAAARAKLEGKAEVVVAETPVNNEALKNLEASMLTQFVDDMMPKDTGGLYGEGTAGEIWQQLFVEHVATAAAEKETLQLAEKLNASGTEGDRVKVSLSWPYFGEYRVTPYAG